MPPFQASPVGSFHKDAYSLSTRISAPHILESAKVKYSLWYPSANLTCAGIP